LPEQKKFFLGKIPISANLHFRIVSRASRGEGLANEYFMQNSFLTKTSRVQAKLGADEVKEISGRLHHNHDDDCTLIEAEEKQQLV
jgi:hypothetical protein